MKIREVVSDEIDKYTIIIEEAEGNYSVYCPTYQVVLLPTMKEMI